MINFVSECFIVSRLLVKVWIDWSRYCAYAFKVMAATADEVAAVPVPTEAGDRASTTPSHTPAPNATGACGGPVTPADQSGTPLGKRSASSTPRSASGSIKVPRLGTAAAAERRSPGSAVQAAAARSDGCRSGSCDGPGLAGSPAPAAHTTKQSKKSRLLRELESDRGYVGSAQCSPEQAAKLGRRQRRRTSASSSEEAAQTSVSPPKRAATAAPRRAPKPEPAKNKGTASMKTTTVAAAEPAPATGKEPSGRTMNVTGELRKAQRDDIGRRVEVHRDKSGWYGGTIRGFDKDQFRVEYDDGSVQLEVFGDGKTFFPDPVEETRCQKPAKPSELALVQDAELNMALLCRVMGARPDGGRRVRLIGWSRQNDLTCWPRTAKNEPTGGRAYLLDMTASNKQRATRFNSQIKKIDKAQGDMGRARVGSVVTVSDLPDDYRVWDVAIRQASPKSEFQLMYLFADKKTWVPENKLLSVDGRLLKPDKPTVKSGRGAAVTEGAASAQSAAARSPDGDVAGAALIPTTMKQNPISTKVKLAVQFVAAYEEDWDDLTTKEQEAARELGLSAEQWARCEDPPCRAQLWNEMTPALRKAATVLGWTSKRWDSDPAVEPPPLTNPGAVADHREDDSCVCATRSTGSISLRACLSRTSRRRSTSWEELDGSKAQHMKLELDEAVGDDGDMAYLPNFLHFIEHTTQLGHVPPKSVYDQLVSQLVDTEAAATCAGSVTFAPSPSVMHMDDANSQSQTFTQEMEDEERVEALNKSRRAAIQAQGAVHATLHGLLCATSRDVGDAALGGSIFSAASSGWSPVSTRRGGGSTSNTPKQEDFQQFERSLSAVHAAVRAVTHPQSTTAAATQLLDDCSGASLFLDYTTTVLAEGRPQVGARIPEASMAWKLLHSTNPSGSEGQIKQVLQHCIGIVDAASVAFVANDRLSLCMGDASSAVQASRHHLWIVVAAAQRLLGLAVAVGATSHCSNFSPPSSPTKDGTASAGVGVGDGRGLIIAPAQSTVLYQQYLERLTTPHSKQLFFETLPHPALQMHMLDRVLCPGKQQQQSGGGTAIWRRVFAWAHCPPQLRASSTSAIQQQASQASTAARPMRERIERLLVFYTAAQIELEQIQCAEVGPEEMGLPHPPEGFKEDLQKQQSHLRALLFRPASTSTPAG